MGENADKDILLDFQEESRTLIQDMLQILEDIEGDFAKVKRLEEFGQTVDRIMGGAKSLALNVGPESVVNVVGDYAALCKAVGYKASQIEKNRQFYDICVALLLDATEIMQEMNEMMVYEEGKKNIKDLFSKTFLERLQWVSNQFSDDLRSSVAVKTKPGKKMQQNEIDDLLKKLGLG